ncbi:hypothetical protein EPA93_03810 [Ktedonosporobacter rubrisoli]|uniref:Uncharacterized protein n=1 Tax=Ktedonosporobacter rubrisoli TaxID=2509675 RepID=A0A4P6JJ85_KTERU|nr:hypothetical protein [Ktedonosporobacter rubrisoli]QBD75165.1 hypothetical protein EPA93_03810 [Ktedonosporobacter rubrisoli]
MPAQKTAPQTRQRPKIKSSFGAVLSTQQQVIEQDTNTLVSQLPDIPVSQDTAIPVSQHKKAKEQRTKKGVYLKPSTAKWLDIQAATEGREISEITEEALILLQKAKSENQC